MICAKRGFGKWQGVQFPKSKLSSNDKNMISRQFGHVILTKLLFQNGNLLKLDCKDLENCISSTKAIMLENVSHTLVLNFVTKMIIAPPISCPVKLRPNG